MKLKILVRVDRGLSLEGRANLVLEDVQPHVTRVSVNVRYVLTRVRESERMARSTDTIGFSSGEHASFGGSEGTIICGPSGAFEAELLRLFQK